jgi:hypothetical protein
MTNRACGLFGIFVFLMCFAILSGCDARQNAETNSGDRVIRTATPLCVDAIARPELEGMVKRLNEQAGAPQFVTTSLNGGAVTCAENMFEDYVPATQSMLNHRVDYDLLGDLFETAAIQAPSDNP